VSKIKIYLTDIKSSDNVPLQITKKGELNVALLQLTTEQEVIDAFVTKSKEYGIKPPDMHRELVKAFAEGRVTIKPSIEKEKLFSELYDKE